MKSIVVQPFSSLFETPRIQLSREAFENSGIGIFSSEKIPFADRTGPALAQNLVNILTARMKSLQKSGQSFPNGIHIYELGTGTGILAKRILDLLKINHKDIYSKVVLHLSDISKPMINQLKNLPAFKKHRGHVSFEVVDAIKPKFTHKPLVVYFTNLIDSLPYHRQILIQDGQIFEFQVQTSIKEGAQIIDATSYPPKVLEEEEIVKILSSSDLNRRLILAHQILPILEEEAKFKPIDEVLNIGKEEREDLKKLADFQNKIKPFVFNYSYIAKIAIQKIIQQLENGGFMFFSDFGIASGEYEQVLYLQCGSVIFLSVDFPSFIQAAEMAGKTCYLTSNAPGYPQEMLIDTLQSDKQIKILFKKESIGDWQVRVNDFLENVKIILSESSEGKGEQSEKINRLYHSLPKEAKYDYRLLNDLAFFLLQAKFYEEANFYADNLLKNYGHAVGVFYHLVKGKVAQEQGELKVAEEFFKEAAEGKKGFFAWAYLGELYWKQERYFEYIEAIKEYLKYTRAGNYLRSIFSIALAQEKLYGTKTAQKTLEELTSIGAKLKTLSEPEQEALKQAEQRLIF